MCGLDLTVAGGNGMGRALGRSRKRLTFPFPVVRRSMAKPELGTKRVCVSCGAKFYDLTKQPAICPKCSTEQPAEQPRLRRAAGNPLDDKRRPKAASVPGLEDADVEVEVADDDSDEDVLEDTSDLDDEAEAIVDVEVESNDEER